MRIPGIIFIGLLAVFLSFQSLYGGELQVSADFQVGLPQGDFKQQLDRGGIGVGFMGGYRFGGSPVMFGLDMGFMNFGKDERVEPLSSTIPDLTVQVANDHNLFHGDLLLRLITPNPDASNSQNYPNPFNPATTIRFALPDAGKVQLTVYDILGREVETLVDNYKEAGYYEAVFDAGQLSSGVYLYQLRAGDFVETKRLMLLK